MESTTQSYVNRATRIISRAAGSQLLSSAGVGCLGVALFGCGSGLAPIQQQGLTGNSVKNTLYTVQDLGVVGANLSQPGQPLVITNSGWIVGDANVGAADHAVLWYGGPPTIDIGTPGLGGNSFGLGVNESGVAVGEAENTAGPSTTEDFCGFQFLGYSSSPLPCVPFIRQNGQMVPLPTLGGANGVAYQINNNGTVAGYAENTTLDPNCAAPQKYQFKPVVWLNGRVQALPTGNDSDGVAVAINDVGQVIGMSGSCGPFDPIALWYLQPAHALLWEDGVATDLGNLGGAPNNSAHGINNRGQVVGQSGSYAFLWTAASGMQNLGTVGDDVFSFGLGINDAGQIVGLSANADFSNIRAFISRSGTLVDLNSLITGTNSLYLVTACSITSKGAIIGIAFDPNTGLVHGYLATPTNKAADGSNFIKSPILPEALRSHLRLAAGI